MKICWSLSSPISKVFCQQVIDDIIFFNLHENTERKGGLYANIHCFWSSKNHGSFVWVDVVSQHCHKLLKRSRYDDQRLSLLSARKPYIALWCKHNYWKMGTHKIVGVSILALLTGCNAGLSQDCHGSFMFNWIYRHPWVCTHNSICSQYKR